MSCDKIEKIGVAKDLGSLRRGDQVELDGLTVLSRDDEVHGYHVVNDLHQQLTGEGSNHSTSVHGEQLGR